MSKLFSGLEAFGLGKLEKMNVYEEDTQKKNGPEGQEVKAEKKELTEADMLFDKTYTCPVCDKEFQSKSIRIGKVKLLSADTDLRPKYQNVDSLKYDALVCPHCGYASLSRFFNFMLPAQAKMIKEQISANFKGIEIKGDYYTYDEAIARHKLALACTVAKKARTSERAYTCLKLAWLCRGKAESLSKDTKDYDEVIKELQEEEKELLENAFEGFDHAYSRESFPMCGMDELSVMYLMADLARRVGRYDEAGRYISKVLTSRNANTRIKNKAREIKELIQAEKGEA